MEEKNVIMFAAKMIEDQLNQAKTLHLKKRERGVKQKDFSEWKKIELKRLRLWHEVKGQTFQLCAMALNLTEDKLASLMDKIFSNIEEYSPAKLSDLIGK